MGILMKNGKNYSSASNPMSVTQDEEGTIVLEGFVGDAEHFVDNGAREEINEVKASLITTFVRFNSSTNLWTTDNSKYPKAAQFTTVIRNQNTGAIHILWYDNSVSAFRTAHTVTGSAPSNNNFATIEFFG